MNQQTSSKAKPAPASRFGSKTNGWLRILIAIVVAVAVGAGISLVPLPFVIYSPGPTFNVLGSQNDVPILEVEGGDAESTGELRMVTISEVGGPGSTVTAPALLYSLFTSGRTIRPYSQVYPRGLTAEDMQAISSSQMESSHSTSSVAALSYLGYDLPTVITIVGIAEGSDAKGKIEDGDRLVSIEVPGVGTYPMDAPDAPFALVRTLPPGTEVEVTIERDDKERTETVKTMADPDSDGTEAGSKLGIILDLDIDMPIDVVIHLERVGGPSAGMIFALGIIDELTGGNLTGGNSIAGTGSISYDGKVEPIGGIKQKMYGAQRDGADWFLAPTENCDSVVGNVPSGLKTTAVGTLEEAVSAVEAIAADEGDSLPTCETVLAGDAGG